MSKKLTINCPAAFGEFSIFVQAHVPGSPKMTLPVTSIWMARLRGELVWYVVVVVFACGAERGASAHANVVLALLVACVWR